MEHRVLLVRERNRRYELFGMELLADEFADDLSNGVGGSGQLGGLLIRAITHAGLTLFYSSYVCCQGRPCP
jgi:hypothetical protein